MRRILLSRALLVAASLLAVGAVSGCAPRDSQQVSQPASQQASRLASQPAATRTVASGSDEARAAAAFTAFRNAAGAGDVRELAQQVAQSTADALSRWRELALDAAPQALERESLTDQVAVLRLRSALPEGALARMPGRALVAAAIDQGIVDVRGFASMQAGHVEVVGDRAEIQMERGGQEIGVAVPLVREASGWHVDLPPLLKMAEPGLAAKIEGRPGPRPMRIMNLVGELSGKPVSNQLWQPLRR
ncbi:MAG: hypothetical protein AB8H80_08290 [Planctomycetota bacterium]